MGSDSTESPSTDAATSRRRSFEAVRTVRTPIVAYLLSRVLVFACAAFALALRRPPFGILEALGAWDGAWYVGIAVYGYPAEIGQVLGQQAYSSLVFFPLFPMTVRVVGLLTGLPALPAAILVSHACGLASSLLLWHLTRRLVDANVADRVSWLYCFFPGSVALSMAYAEAMFLVVAMACLVALHSHRWAAAGLMAAFATATRQQGVAVALACGVAAVDAIRRARAWSSLVAPVLAPLGLAAFLLFVAIHTGDVGTWFQARQAWAADSAPGITRLYGIVGGSVYGQLSAVFAVAGVAWIATCIAVAFRTRTLDLAAATYTTAIVVSILLFTKVGPQPRYLMVAFPLFIPLGAWLSRRGSRYVTEGFAVVLALTTTIYTLGLEALP